MKQILFFLGLFFYFNATLYAQCDKIDSLEAILPELAENRKKVDILNELATEYKSINHKKSYLYAKEAADLAQNLSYKTGQALALISTAMVSYEVNPQSIDESVNAYENAIAIYKKLKGKEANLAATYKNYGDFYYQISYAKKEYLDSAAKYYLKAHERYTALADKEQAAKVSEFIAEVYFELGNEAKALKFSRESIDESLKFNKARIISKSLEGQISAQNAFKNVLIGGFVLLGIFMVMLVAAFLATRNANKRLEIQKNDLARKNEEIEKQNQEIEKQNQEIQNAFKILETRNKEIDRQNKEILLQTEELEMRYIEIAEKNEEIMQQKEEISTQRDHMEEQAKELEQQAEALQKSYEKITILSRIGQSITSSLNFAEIFNTVYGYITQLMPAEGFNISQYHPEDRELEYKFIVEHTQKMPLSKISMDNSTNPAVWCVKTSRSMLVNQHEDFKNYDLGLYAIDPSFNSMIYYPLTIEGKTIGAVGVLSEKVYAFSQNDIEILKTLASYTAIALKNAETYERLNAAQEQLIESEKMAALGNLVAGVAHEINTPVGICVTAASRLNTKTKQFAELFGTGAMKRKDLSDYLEVMEEGNKIILSNLTRAADLVQSFKRVSVEQTSETKRLFNLKTYLQETITTLNPELKNKPYEIILDAEDIEINSYAGAFSQIITNLVMNSLIHAFKGRNFGTMKIEVKQRGKNLLMTYTDDGKGMPPDVVAQIFEPFFTTNRDGGGTGLGMHIVYNLAVQKLGGKVNCSSELGNGVVFVFEIPMEI